jgi:hypothetical protein
MFLNLNVSLDELMKTIKTDKKFITVKIYKEFFCKIYKCLNY